MAGTPCALLDPELHQLRAEPHHRLPLPHRAGQTDVEELEPVICKALWPAADEGLEPVL